MILAASPFTCGVAAISILFKMLCRREMQRPDKSNGRKTLRTEASSPGLWSRAMLLDREERLGCEPAGEVLTHSAITSKELKSRQ
jgi:hypothetical protein